MLVQVADGEHDAAGVEARLRSGGKTRSRLGSGLGRSGFDLGLGLGLGLGLRLKLGLGLGLGPVGFVETRLLGWEDAQPVRVTGPR